MAIDEMLQEVKSAKHFYRDYYRRAINILIVVLILILFLVMSIFYIQLTRPMPKYYTTSSNGHLGALKPWVNPPLRR